MNRTLPLWRSILYVPANVSRFVEAACRSGADAIQLDLEDSVAPSEKAAAREGLRDAVARVGSLGADVLVRINRPLSLAVRDIEAAVAARVHALTLTKVESASHVQLLDELVGECEARQGLESGHTRLILLVESARALQQVHEIAAASQRVVGVALGTEDFANDMGMAAVDEALLYPKQMLAIAARAAGVLPIGFIGSVAALDDDAAFRSMLRRSRRFGFECATCIHPSQVAAVNEEYGVRDEELAAAQRLVAESECQTLRGVGAFRFEGRMVDAPLVSQARKRIAKAAAFSKSGALGGSGVPEAQA